MGASIAQEDKIAFKGNAENSCNRTDGLNLVDRYLKQFDSGMKVKYVTNTGELGAVEYDKVDQVLGEFLFEKFFMRRVNLTLLF